MGRAGFFVLTSASGLILLGMSAPPREGSPDLSAYRGWTKVNPRPVRMADRVALLCRMPTPADMREAEPPHGKKYITVFVNDKGAKAMFAAKPSFPTGSVIVKEKLSKLDSQTPELLTVMVKRNKGFAPEVGDWEFLVADAKGRVTAHGKSTASCSSCHKEVPESDYVFRSY